MRALTWHGLHDVRVENAPDPEIVNPRDASQSRFSLPYFVHPRSDADLTPLASCVALCDGEVRSADAELLYDCIRIILLVYVREIRKPMKY